MAGSWAQTNTGEDGMSIARDDSTRARSLEILGVSAAEERAYRWLLMHPGGNGATAEDLAARLNLSTLDAQKQLEALEAKALVTRTPEKPRRYVPSAPDMAMKALVLRRQQDLENAKLTIQEIQEQTNAVRRDAAQEQMVELITTREAERQVFEQMALTAQEEFIALIRPPMRVSTLKNTYEQEYSSQREAMRRGVHYRSIVDTGFLELPGALGATQDDIKAGEEKRVVSDLPFKLVAADHRIALIPLSLKRSDSPSLLVRSSALLDALYALFETLWERAEPFPPSGSESQKITSTESCSSTDIESVLSLMVAGLSDKGVAYEMGVSLRTFRRRVNTLMNALGARTRFQAGWLAARAHGQRLPD